VEIVTVALILLLAVVVSGTVAPILPISLPLPLVQIVIGALIAAVTDLGVQLRPGISFLLFLPPLLFLDGWRIPKEGLFRDKRTILELAFGLVLFTSFVLDIDGMTNGRPLAVAFALATILSPTDPIDVPKAVLEMQASQILRPDLSMLTPLPEM
jgi:monovalent cation/hydrogen antiporter